MSNKMKKKQVQNQAQQGRSMIEMLGVLAIIGVISIGGISGYRWGMDKHVANQILNEINLNSLQLAMLLQKGNANGVMLSLGSPYDDEERFRTVNYGFDYGCKGEEMEDYKCNSNETGYYIAALGLPERVATMVSESASHLQNYYQLQIDESQKDENQKDVTIFFDINAKVLSDESQPETPEHVYTPEVTTTTTTTKATTTTTTSAGRYCGEHGTEIFYSTDDPNEKWAFCQCAPGYTGERCEEEINKKCTTNENCGEKQYCHLSDYNKGECKSNTPDGMIEINGKTFLLKTDGMIWEGVQNFCTSHNKSMVSFADLDCTKDSFCQSDTLQKLQKKFGGWSNGYYWMSDLYSSSTPWYIQVSACGFSSFPDFARFGAFCVGVDN